MIRGGCCNNIHGILHKAKQTDDEYYLRMCKALIAALPDNSIDKDALFAEFKNNLKLKIDVEVE